MSTLRQVSDGIAAALEAVAPHVVEVRGRRRPASGIVWGPDRVVTAAHTLRRDTELEVVDATGKVHPAELAGRDPSTDLALLRVPGATFAPPTWADPATVKVGSIVLPVGRAGASVRTVLGIVADKGGPWQTMTGGHVDAWIDVDANLPPGFSGGPLVDADGHVVGLSTNGLTPRGAVLVRSTVERVVDRLEKHGSAAPGYLGVGFFPAGDGDALVVVSVAPDGPGARAGVAVGDLLRTRDGIAVHGGAE
jgi:S1-C subfamily serine protease